MDLGWDKPPRPSVDFTNTTTSFLAGRPARAAASVRRLRLHLRALRAAPGGQLNADLGSRGAMRVAPAPGQLRRRPIRARSAIRGPRALPRRLLDTAHSLTVAYGYRPGRACGYSRSCSSWLPPRSRYAALSPRCAPLSPAPYTPPKDTSDPAPRIRQPQQEIRVPPRGDQLEPPAGTGRSAASTPFATPSAPTFRSYHPAKEPPGTPALTLPTEPSCHGGPTPPPYPAGCHLRFLFCPWQDLPARCDGPDT